MNSKLSRRVHEHREAGVREKRHGNGHKVETGKTAKPQQATALEAEQVPEFVQLQVGQNAEVEREGAQREFRKTALQSDGGLGFEVIGQGTAPPPGEVRETEAVAKLRASGRANLEAVSVPVGNTTVTIFLGRQTELHVDAVVVPCFPRASARGGLTGAIMQAGGGFGVRQYERLASQGRLPESTPAVTAQPGVVGSQGDVVMTPSGNSRWPRLLHASILAAGDGREFDVVSTAVYNALKLATEQGLKSVVFPSLGTGEFEHLDIHEAARAIAAGVLRAAGEGLALPEVTFATGSPKKLAALQQALGAGVSRVEVSSDLRRPDVPPPAAYEPPLDASRMGDVHCYLATHGRQTGQPHRVELWFAAQGKTVYLTNSTRGDWTKNMCRQDEVTVRVGDTTYRGVARKVSDPAELERANALVFHKYEACLGADLRYWQSRSEVFAIDVQGATDVFNPERALAELRTATGERRQVLLRQLRDFAREGTRGIIADAETLWRAANASAGHVAWGDSLAPLDIPDVEWEQEVRAFGASHPRLEASLVTLDSPEAVLERVLTDDPRDVRIAFADYYRPPSAEHQATREAFRRQLVRRLGGEHVALVGSPSTDVYPEGDCNCLTSTKVALQEGAKLLMVTAARYLPAINAEPLPESLREAYEQTPKLIVPDRERYGWGAMFAANSFVASGGVENTLSDFAKSIKLDHRVVLFVNTALGEVSMRDDGMPTDGPRYIQRMIETLRELQRTGKDTKDPANYPFPFVPARGFTAEFLSTYADAIERLTVTVESNGQNGMEAAVEAAARHLSPLIGQRAI